MNSLYGADSIRGDFGGAQFGKPLKTAKIAPVICLEPLDLGMKDFFLGERCSRAQHFPFRMFYPIRPF